MVVSLASTGGASKIYCVNGGGMTSKNAAAWIEAKLTDHNKRRGVRKAGGQGGTGGEGEIRLIQDFEFPEASNKLKTTRDGKYLIASGTYKPRMKVFDLEELSLKTERVTDAENVDFCILSSDWTKALHLQADRSMELHTQSSSHYRVRFPRHGRAIQYHFPSCDALVGGEGSEVWRFNLEAGRFMKPFCLEGSPENDGGEQGGFGGGGGDAVTGVNCIDINPAHQLLAFGTETRNGKGTVELWDPRSRTRAGILRLPYATLAANSMSSASAMQFRLPGVDDAAASGGVSVTALASRSDGLNLAVGTSTGHTLLYDLRANRPYTTKDQGYGLPVKKVQWVENSPTMSGDAEREGGWVASTDEKVVKIWGKDTGNNLVAINPPMPINDLHIYPGTGLVFLANETSPMTGYYVPQLGPAPKWCRFLDNMTEEMGEDQEQLLYDDYKFIDRQELEELNLQHLIGTDTLKPYMHGYFVDFRLYTKARAIANPFAYAEHRDKLIRDKLAAEQESRIRGAKKAAGSAVPGVKVNKHLAKKIKEQEERARKREAGEADEDAEMDDGEKRKRKKKSAKDQVDVPSLLQDSRFGDLFANPDFEIDETSREFMLLNPSTKPRQQQEDEDEDESEEDGEGVAEGEFESEDDDDESGDSDSSQEGELGFDYQRRPIEPPKRVAKVPSIRTSTSASSSSAPARPRPTLVAADASDDEDLTTTRSRPASLAAPSAAARASQTLSQRAREAAGSVAGKRRQAAEQDAAFDAANGDDIIKGAPGGGMEMSFIPSAKSVNEEKEKKKEVKDKKTKEKKEKAKYGMGLETRSGGDQDEEDEKPIEGEDGSGRTRMRKPARSASRNKTRHL